MRKTFNEWSAAGFKIKKGSKATWVDGVAMFSAEQIEIKLPPPQRQRSYGYFGNDDYDYDGPGEYEYALGWHK